MDTRKRESRSKDLIPKKAQIVLLIVGIPLLIFSGVRLATTMGWIGGPPKAKKVVQRKEDRPKPPPEAGAPKPDTPGTTPATPRRTRRSGAPDLESIELPARDPLRDLGSPPSEAPAGATPGAAKPPAPPSPPPSPPPLPPPLPTASATGPFPSPVTGGEAALPPAMVVRRPTERGLPPALSASYPLLKRGGRAPRTASVSLVGTISGPQGSLAVVRPSNATGAPGRYVRPGQTISGPGGEEVKAISPGKLTISTRGRTQELSLPTPSGEQGTGPPGASGESPGPSAPVVEDSRGISPPTE